MKKEDLDALAGLYETVYSPEESGEYLNEEQYLNESDRSNPYTGNPQQKMDAARARLRAAQAARNAPAKPQPQMKGLSVGQGGFRVNNKPVNSGVSPIFQRPGTEEKPKSSDKPAAKPAATRPTAPAAKPAATRPTAPAAKPAATMGSPKVAPSSSSSTTSAAPKKTFNPLMQKTFGYQTGYAPDQIKNDAKKMAVTGSVKNISQSYEWPSAKTIRDIAGAYASIYEAKKKDQDQDGDNDFADVRIARMIASGMSKAEAIAAVRNKEYNEEYELDEATRMRKELGKEGEIETRKELAARSRAYKRSGSVDKTIAAAERGADRPYIKHKRGESDSDRSKREERQSRTLRGLASSRRGSVRDDPRAGMRGYAAKVEGSDKDLQTARQKAMAAGTLTPKEKKQLGEEYAIYEIVASYLLENNFAETIDDANVIIENMSETWVAQILESFE